MGLPPETKRLKLICFNNRSGDIKYLVATDAVNYFCINTFQIGMGWT